MIARAALVAGLALALAPNPAHACSASRLTEGDTADERMAGRSDFRRVTFYLRRWARNGEYELLDWAGELVPGNGIMDIADDGEGQP